jgi:hypothetical protein
VLPPFAQRRSACVAAGFGVLRSSS